MLGEASRQLYNVISVSSVCLYLVVVNGIIFLAVVFLL